MHVEAPNSIHVVDRIADSPARRHDFKEKGHKSASPFWTDLQGKQGIYLADNLNVRWLSGAQENAKCRIQLFDLVIADKLYNFAAKKVMCPLNGWKGNDICKDNITRMEHRSKPEPLKGIADPYLVGAWVDRLRPSFEIYDYSRILSWKQTKERGVQDLPELSDVPRYMATLAEYTNLNVIDAHLRNACRVSLENEDCFSPPVDFCNRMKQIWTNNPDGKQQKSISAG